MSVNHQILLKSYPIGAPTENDFSLVETAIPEPAAGEVLNRTIYLSLDPYMRGRMSDTESYAPPVKLGSVMVGSTEPSLTGGAYDSVSLIRPRIYGSRDR